MAEEQEKNTGYTGEYGNPVEPASEQENQAEDSTYRYSYQKGSDDPVHSGNYYAGSTSGQNMDDGNQQSAPYNQSNGSWQNQTNSQMPNNDGQNMTNSQMPNSG